MAIFKLSEESFIKIKNENKTIKIIKKAAFDNFNEDILGLGKLTTKSITIQALSVIFDLEGFTDFCKQIDPQLGVPEYLNKFLQWTFNEIKSVLTNETYDEGYKTWADLPFFSKFLGDGILFLWNTENMSDINIRNVVVAMGEICENYILDFLPSIKKDIISPPTKLRCGIARGAIYSVGNGSDYIGPCINMSARLQKLNSLSFSFSRRGIDPTKFSDQVKDTFVTKKVNIRGIGNQELVCILKEEFNNLQAPQKKEFFEI